MELYFHKYQGTGNDFILIDDRSLEFPVSIALIKKLCDRKFGVGADGLILIQNHEELAYKMIYFNPDGSQSLCGNGSRCGFAFARELKMADKEAAFETTDGVHKIKLEGGLIHLQLFDISGAKKLSEKAWYLNTGSPHHILLTEELNKLDVRALGSQIRHSESYSSQNGTNVNFAQLLPNKVRIRTYERGVEDETLSCGTGATAVGIIAGKLGYKSPVSVETNGGELKVFFEKDNDKFTNIWLAGPVEKVFSGSITI